MPKCPTCGKEVYFSEQVKAGDKAFHKLCFKCCSCSKQLTAGAFSEDKDKNLYCPGCYGKLKGPAGYGFGGGGGLGLSSYTNDQVAANAKAGSAGQAGGGGSVAYGGGGGGGAAAFCSKCGAKGSGGKFCTGCGSPM